MSTETDIRAAMAEGADGCVDDAFEIIDDSITSSDASVWVAPPRSAGRPVCRVHASGAAPAVGEECEGYLLRPRATAVRPACAAAILSSCIVAAALEGESFSAPALADLPWPKVEASFEAQLAVLWHRFVAVRAARSALVGAFDRVVAELYGLGIDDLMRFERQRDVQLSLGL